MVIPLPFSCPAKEEGSGGQRSNRHVPVFFPGPCFSLILEQAHSVVDFSPSLFGLDDFIHLLNGSRLIGIVINPLILLLYLLGNFSAIFGLGAREDVMNNFIQQYQKNFTGYMSGSPNR